MSLGVVIKGPEGVVLAADSRITLEAKKSNAPPLSVNFDNATKLLTFYKPHSFVGAVTYGIAVIGLRTAHSFIPEFEIKLEKEKKINKRLKVEEYSKELSNFYMARWKEAMPNDYQGPSMTFIVGGYDPGSAYGTVFLFQIPDQPIPKPRNPGQNEFGMTWGGQLQVASRLIHGYDPIVLDIIRKKFKINDSQIDELIKTMKSQIEFPIPYNVLPLQDCVELATFLIRSTIIAQNLAVGIRGVGGPIDVAIITRTKGLELIQQKRIHGETT